MQKIKILISNVTFKLFYYKLLPSLKYLNMKEYFFPSALQGHPYTMLFDYGAALEQKPNHYEQSTEPRRGEDV